MSTWKRPPTVKYPQAPGKYFTLNYICASEDVNQVKCPQFSHLGIHEIC